MSDDEEGAAKKKERKKKVKETLGKLKEGLKKGGEKVKGGAKKAGEITKKGGKKLVESAKEGKLKTAGKYGKKAGKAVGKGLAVGAKGMSETQIRPTGGRGRVKGAGGVTPTGGTSGKKYVSKDDLEGDVKRLSPEDYYGIKYQVFKAKKDEDEEFPTYIFVSTADGSKIKVKGDNKQAAFKKAKVYMTEQGGFQGRKGSRPSKGVSQGIQGTQGERKGPYFGLPRTRDESKDSRYGVPYPRGGPDQASPQFDITRTPRGPVDKVEPGKSRSRYGVPNLNIGKGNGSDEMFKIPNVKSKKKGKSSQNLDFPKIKF